MFPTNGASTPQSNPTDITRQSAAGAGCHSRAPSMWHLDGLGVRDSRRRPLQGAVTLKISALPVAQGTFVK